MIVFGLLTGDWHFSPIGLFIDLLAFGIIGGAVSSILNTIGNSVR